MRKITTIKDFNELATGDKFYLIKGGNIFIHVYCCPHPTWDQSIVALNDGKHSEACTFSSYDLTNKSYIFLTGKYDNEEVGNYMISQLKKEIGDIEAVYLTKGR